MRQRTGRQKFHDLRLLTFQDWVVPHYNIRQRKVNGIMKNGRLPVFGYTKADNGPPLSPISSQFAWAGHTLPDLVQEQSERLLKRLERPRTADNRDSRYKNSQMRGGKLSRPSTAAPLRNRTPAATSFHVNGTKYDSTVITLNELSPDSTPNLPQAPACPESHPIPSPVSERSSSPDFIANMYKEYEKKLSSNHDEETLSQISDIPSPISPTMKLLRRPNAQLHTNKKSDRKESSSSQAPDIKVDNTVHCVIKLPSDQTNLSEQCNGGNQHPKNMPPKSETWLDLSELCQLSDEESPQNINFDVRLHRPPIASDSGSSLKILDLLSQCDGIPQDSESKKLRTKIARPSSSNSKNLKKFRSKSRLKKMVAKEEESPKDFNRVPQKSSEGRARKGRSSDKLREEIETQMSKLDFDSSARERHDVVVRNLSPVKRPLREVKLSPPATATHIAQTKRNMWKATPAHNNKIPCFKSSLPIKKVPIQILSDPFK